MTVEMWRLAQQLGRFMAFSLLVVVTVAAPEMPWWAKGMAWAWWCQGIAPPFAAHKDH